MGLSGKSYLWHTPVFTPSDLLSIWAFLQHQFSFLQELHCVLNLMWEHCIDHEVKILFRIISRNANSTIYQNRIL